MLRLDLTQQRLRFLVPPEEHSRVGFVEAAEPGIRGTSRIPLDLGVLVAAESLEILGQTSQRTGKVAANLDHLHAIEERVRAAAYVESEYRTVEGTSECELGKAPFGRDRGAARQEDDVALASELQPEL